MDNVLTVIGAVGRVVSPSEGQLAANATRNLIGYLHGCRPKGDF
jgi:hypothetical protein